MLLKTILVRNFLKPYAFVPFWTTPNPLPSFRGVYTLFMDGPNQTA